MIQRVFKIDVSKCKRCGGELEIVCAVTDPFEIKRYLTYVNIDHRPPPRGPPRIDAEELLQGAIDFDQRLPADD